MAALRWPNGIQNEPTNFFFANFKLNPLFEHHIRRQIFRLEKQSKDEKLRVIQKKAGEK